MTAKALGHWNDEPLVVNPVVNDSKTTFTGLYDSKGQPLYRTQPPIGFGRDEEWK